MQIKGGTGASSWCAEVSGERRWLPPRAVTDSVAALRRTRRLRVSFACSEACTVRFTLSLGRTTLASALATLQQAGVRNATLRVRSRAGRRALDRARRARSRRKVSLVLRGTATDGAGNAASRRTTLRLPRR